MSTSTSDTIAGYYQRILQRDPGADELNSWVTAVNTGSLTLQDVRTALISLPETNQFVDPIVRLYNAAFGRVPDAPGLDAWVDAYRADARNPDALETIARQFLTSPEANNRFGGGEGINAVFVTNLYQNVLGRLPDQEGFDFWVNSPATRADMLRAFSESPEHLARSDVPVNQFLDRAGAGTETYTGNLYGVQLTGTAGNDTLIGGAGNDTLSGEFGLDRLEGGPGDDRLFGGIGEDTLIGGTGADTLDGGTFDDRLFGGEGNDLLIGGDGNDGLNGDFGDDSISGGEGADTIVGGIGADTMDGGTGADIFRYSSFQDSRPDSPDLIIGFNQSEGDRIDFRGLFTGVPAEGDFTFIGTQAFGTGPAASFAQIRYSIDVPGNRTLVQLDITGDADLDPNKVVVLSGQFTLTANDFVLF